MTSVLTAPAAVETEAATGPKLRNFLSIDHRAYFKDLGINPELSQAFTVNNVEALPEELQFQVRQHGAGILPGIVFQHLSIRGEITNQLRPDMPEASVHESGCGKYLFAKGAFNGPFIHATQQHLVGKLDRVVIVEGTKQFRSAITIAVADGSIEEILFIGIPGCTGGVQEHNLSNDWMGLIPDGAHVTIIFDADVASKILVWKAADKLWKHLKNVVTGAKIKIVEIPAYGGVGLDDYLNNQPEASRSKVLHNMVLTAEAKMPPRPSAAMQKRLTEAGTPIVDMVNGTISSPPVEQMGSKIPGRVMMNAAAKIVRSYAEYNDLNPDITQIMRFDLEVATKVSGVLQTFTVKSLTTPELENPRRWIDRISGGFGANITFVTRDVENIVGAIRAASTQEMIEVLKRTGLRADKDGYIRFMDGEGALGHEDKITDLRSKINESTMSSFVLPDPHQLNEDQKKEACQHVLRMWDICVDPTSFLLFLGALILSVHGVTPKGTVGSVGARGSGKTTIMLMILRMLGLDVSVATFDSSPGAVGNLGAGVENLIQFVDDFQDLSAGGRTAVENNLKGLNMLLRRGYGGADYARSRLRQNRDTGEWETDKGDPCSPFFAVTMERKAIPYGAESSMDRLLLAEVTRANSFANSEDAQTAMAYAKSPLGAQALAIVIADILDRIAHFGTGDESFPANGGEAKLKAWKNYMEEERHCAQLQLMDDFPGIEDPRRYEVASSPILGVYMMLETFRNLGFIDNAERDLRCDQASALIMGAAKAWQENVIRKGGGTEGYIAKMSDAVTSGSSMIGEDWKTAHVPADGIRTKILGWHHTYKGEECIVLIPSEAARICGTTVDRLELDLAAHLMVDSKGNKKPSVPCQDVKGSRKRLWALKLSAWNGSHEDFDAADHKDLPEDF